MAKNIQEARELLEAERENPFRSALNRLSLLTKSNDKVEEEEDDEELFAVTEQDSDEADDDEDEDDEELFELDDDEDDDEDEDEDEDEDVVAKSQKSSRRSQTASVSSADQAEAHQAVKRAKNTRATDPASNAHSKVAHHFDDLDDDEVDEGQYDFDDDDGDQGDADHTDGSPNLSEVSDEEFEKKPSKRRRNRSKGPDHNGWNTHKSEEDDSDFGLPEAQEQFLHAVMNSPYAEQIDASKALREVATMFGSELAKERAIIGEVAKSYEALGDLPADIAYLKGAVQVLASALTKSINQQEELLSQHASVMKSLTGVASDIELVKSQPASGAPMGYMGQPPSRPSSFTPENSETVVTKRDIHTALAKSVDAGELSTDDAANYMASIDTKGAEGVYKNLPELVRTRIASH
jgi:hypothetical protein